MDNKSQYLVVPIYFFRGRAPVRHLHNLVTCHWCEYMVIKTIWLRICAYYVIFSVFWLHNAYACKCKNMVKNNICINIMNLWFTWLHEKIREYFFMDGWRMIICFSCWKKYKTWITSKTFQILKLAFIRLTC